MRTSKAHNFVALAITTCLIVAGLSSCNNSNNSQKVDDATIKQEIEQYIYPLPSAFEVTNMLNEIEASYIMGIGNDASKAESYLTEKDRAINLGVYTADLAYATTYNQKTEIQGYFQSCENMVRELDFTAAFDQDLPEQIDANLDNKDKLVEIVTNMFQNAYSYLNQQGRTEMSYLVLTGTVVEGLYLTTHISENNFQNPKIIEAILFQKDPLTELEKMMEAYQGSEMISDVYADVKSINAIYAMQEGSTSMTQEQVDNLTDTLTKIREKYVK